MLENTIIEILITKLIQKANEMAKASIKFYFVLAGLLASGQHPCSAYDFYLGIILDIWKDLFLDIVIDIWKDTILDIWKDTDTIPNS